jgi:outer membrane translocation and assembly module TamA
VGHASALANLEVRWTFWKFRVESQQFSLQVAPFFDVGRVFDKVDFSLKHFQPDGGAGLHIGWNQSTIVRFDAGFSREDYGLFIDFGMPF